MYHVTLWDDMSIHRSFDQLNRAKRYARGMGHTGEDRPELTGYPPIAFVANDNGECVYNPCFGKRIGAAVGAIIDAFDSSHF